MEITMDSMDVFRKVVGNNAERMEINQGIHDLYFLVRPASSNLSMDTGNKVIDYATTPEAILTGNFGVRPLPLFRQGDFMFSPKLGWTVVFGSRTTERKEENGERVHDFQGGIGKFHDPVLINALCKVGILYFKSEAFEKDMESVSDADRITRDHFKNKVKVQLFGFDIPFINANKNLFVEAICWDLEKLQ